MDAANRGEATLAMLLAVTTDQRAAQATAVCCEAISSGACQPLAWRIPEGWTNHDSGLMANFKASVESQGDHVNYDSLRVAAEAASGPFTRWRNAVHDHEAENARRLTMMVWTFRTLEEQRVKLGAAGDDTSVIDQMVEIAGRMVAMTWRVAEDFPMEGPFRDWARIRTRRYDLLPKVWRYI